MERINRFYGTNWESINHKFVIDETLPQFNIIITCVDNIQIRKDIQKSKFSKTQNSNPYYRCYYWLDFGNGDNYGQVILGTMNHINQPTKSEKSVEILPTVIEKFTENELKQNNDEPSCSTLEALNRQELLVNSSLAEFGMNILWKLFRTYKISQSGLYMNLNTMTVNPIKI